MSKRWGRAHLTIHVTLSALMISACGGGGGTASSETTTSLDGVVAVGAPVPQANVTVKDSTGASKSTTADASGYYSFTTAEMAPLKAPLLIQATGVVGGSEVTLHSLLETTPSANGAKQVLNVTPATDAITAQTLQADPASVFKDKAPSTVDATKLAAAKERLRIALTDVLTSLGIDATQVDLMSTKFTANSTGLDKVFDLISIQTNASSATERDVVVAEKKPGGQSVTLLSSADSSSVSKLPTLGDESKLDLATVKQFLDEFNQLIKSSTGIKSAAMKDLFDSEFLDNGQDRDALLTALEAKSVGKITLSNLAVNGCTPPASSTSLTGSICYGRMTNTKSDGGVESFAMSFRLGADNKWRAYGNRAPFDFEIKPVALQEWVYTSSSDIAPTSTLKTGINFWFTGMTKVAGVETSTYKSAQLWISKTNGTEGSWTLVTTLKTHSEGSSCPAGTNFLPIDGGSSTGCTNFLVIADEAVIADINTAQASGQLKFRIDAFATTDASGAVSESFPSYAEGKLRLFTAAAAKQAMVDTPTSITATDLGSSAVRFASGGARMNSVSIGVVSMGAAGSSAVFTGWNDPSAVKALNGSASISAASTACLANASTDADTSSCNSTYGTGAAIKRIQLSSDLQGRGVWKSYNLKNF